MKLDKNEAAKELSSLVSDTEIFINDEEHPQLKKLIAPGSKLNWAEYHKQRRS